MFEKNIDMSLVNLGGDFSTLIPLQEEEEKARKMDVPENLPVLALKNSILFPGLVIPITIGRPKSIQAVKKAFNSDKLIAVFSQVEENNEEPIQSDLYEFGTVAKVLKFFKMPDGNTTAILQGQVKCRLDQLIDNDQYLSAGVTKVIDKIPVNDLEFDALISNIKDHAAKIVELSPHIPSEATMLIKSINSSSFLLNFITSNLNISKNEKYQIFKLNQEKDQAELVYKHVDAELNLLEVKNQIESKVRGDLERQQRDFFLNQQLKTIQEELGENPQQAELLELEERAAKKNWPEYVRTHFDKQITKAKRINPQIAEYSVTLNYLETLLDLPWGEYTEDNFDLKRVKKILDDDHYGLEEVKERILEHLAVLKLKGDMKAPIICLVGPPGVGKTSLGKSIATALDRKFIRMSLGGLHDESEIRGHRKTYIGAMPGRIIQSLKKAESSNPVFILDEIDKLGKNFRGDPSSALLEVLDPEQNTNFYDNYLELEYDLSKVLFVATANSLSSIQPALLDRMEIIQISGYSTEEKIEIANRHLVSKQRTEHGLKAKDVKLSKSTIQHLILNYTKESGVRSLDRVIGRVMRYAAKKIAMEETFDATVKTEHLEKILGPSHFNNEKVLQNLGPGVAVGLAWTQVGGDILFIEASKSIGKGKLSLTGNLGDVMKESATTALSYIKANAESLGLADINFSEYDIHIHVPEGAIPKDGPSAGITMLTALCSMFKEKTVKTKLAMSGEITLRGRVLPVGGIKEKVLAAKRYGAKKIILCTRNEKDVLKINENFIKGVEFIYVDHMHEVLDAALS